MISVLKKITQFYMRKGKKHGHEYTTNNNIPLPTQSPY